MPNAHRHAPQPHPRQIVKLRYVATNRYSVCGPGRTGLQFRHRHGMPQAVIDALDRDGEAFAWAYTDRNGRWRLQSLAPKQPW